MDGDLFEPARSNPNDAAATRQADSHDHHAGDASLASKTDNELSQEDQQQLAKLRATDAQVRAHEAAHQAAAGNLAQGGASFDTTTGPDGREYATSGEVSVDTSPGGTPEETIAKAQRIRKAALAPANPSSQDRAVAAKATQMEAKARAELAKETGAGDAAGKQAPAANDASSPARVEQASPPARSNETAPSFARVEHNDSLAQRVDLTRSLVGSALDLIA